MDHTTIREYAHLMDELGLSALEVGEGDGRLRLEKTPASLAMPMPEPMPGPFAAAADKSAEPAEMAAAYMHFDEVTSPMIGVFYSAPTEDSDPYVKVGDRVHKGDTLCIIEAMKLMNEITADEDGIIREICVTNGQVVEYGTVLFRMEQ